MTREQAVQKVVKLRALAQGTSNAHEREVAEQRIASLTTEHHLTPADFKPPEAGVASPGAHPFDRFTDKLRAYTARHPLSKDILGHPLLVDVLAQAKADLPAGSKDRLMDKVGGALGVAGLLGFGENKTVRDVRSIFESVLRNKK